MPITNVSTFGALQSVLQNMSTVQASLNKDQEQVSSGKVSQTYDGISADVQRLTSINAQLARITNYQTGNANVIGQMQTASTALGQAATIASSVKSLLQSQMSGTLSNASFNQQIESQMSALAAVLNTNYGGTFIFGGTHTNTPPVTIPVPASIVAGVPDDSYYIGTDQSPQVRISDSQTITPGVNANEMAFQQLFAAMNMVLQSNSSSSGASPTENMKNAEDLIDSGAQGVNTLQAKINSNILTVQQVNTEAQTIQTYYQGIVSTITTADVVSLSAKVAQDTTTLQASYSVFARISQLSLAQYLK